MFPKSFKSSINGRSRWADMHFVCSSIFVTSRQKELSTTRDALLCFGYRRRAALLFHECKLHPCFRKRGNATEQKWFWSFLKSVPDNRSPEKGNQQVVKIGHLICNSSPPRQNWVTPASDSSPMWTAESMSAGKAKRRRYALSAIHYTMELSDSEMHPGKNMSATGPWPYRSCGGVCIYLSMKLRETQ